MNKYHYTCNKELKNAINSLSSKKIPFLFLLDFKGEKGYVIPVEELDKSDIYCHIRGVEFRREMVSRDVECDVKHDYHNFDIKPIDFKLYKERFDIVQRHIKHGDTYLLNLTFPTLLGSKIDLNNIYNKAKAPYKLLLKDKFVFYSPESFIRIKNGQISSFPMKGTIDCSIDNAEEKLLLDKKELYEHYTIVDLIRNDLSIVATDVTVDRFRYTEEITTALGRKIIQTSSEIMGRLPDNWNNHLGDIIMSLLPAGSISGAPKAVTVNIIEEAEIDSRGFYTGIMGVFDGLDVDSSVIIRYIEKNDNGLYYYRSGGGITSLSNPREEYDELISKIYVPTF